MPCALGGLSTICTCASLSGTYKAESSQQQGEGAGERWEVVGKPETKASTETRGPSSTLRPAAPPGPSGLASSSQQAEALESDTAGLAPQTFHCWAILATLSCSEPSNTRSAGC